MRKQETISTKKFAFFIVTLWTRKISVFGHFTRSGDKVYKRFRIFRLLSVGELPSVVSITDSNVCFKISFLSFENGAIDTTVDGFPYLQAWTKNFE